MFIGARSFTQPKGIVHSLTGNIYMFIIRMGIERKATPCICPGNRSNKGLFVLGILNAPSGHSRPSVRWEYKERIIIKDYYQGTERK